MNQYLQEWSRPLAQLTIWMPPVERCYLDNADPVKSMEDFAADKGDISKWYRVRTSEGLIWTLDIANQCSTYGILRLHFDARFMAGLLSQIYSHDLDPVFWDAKAARPPHNYADILNVWVNDQKSLYPFAVSRILTNKQNGPMDTLIPGRAPSPNLTDPPTKKITPAKPDVAPIVPKDPAPLSGFDPGLNSNDGPTMGGM